MTRRDLVLSLLRNAQPDGVTTAQFLEAGAGSRFGARIAELRAEGYDIISEYQRQGSHKYFLFGTGRSGAAASSLSSLEAANPPAAASGVDPGSDGGRMRGKESAVAPRRRVLPVAEIRDYDGEWHYEPFDREAWARGEWVFEHERARKAA